MTQSSWHKINNLDDGVSRILEAHVAADWRCNIWHVRGRDRDLIIDTGLGLRPIAKDIAMLAERPVIALCTHSHHDHAGGLCQFETRLGHVAEADIFANPTRRQPWPICWNLSQSGSCPMRDLIWRIGVIAPPH